MITPYCSKRVKPFSSVQSTDPTIFLGLRSCCSYDLILKCFDKKCQLQHVHHSLPELLTWDMKKNKEVGSWVFSILKECSIIQKAVFSHWEYHYGTWRNGSKCSFFWSRSASCGFFNKLLPMISSYFDDLNIYDKKLLHEEDFWAVIISTRFCIILFCKIWKAWP